MALARTRQAARRVKDRWKAKAWYQVTSPASFSNKIIAESLADDPQKLMGRRVETTLYELTGDMKQMHIKLYFQVDEVVDRNARTVFAGHSLTSDYERRLTRRGITKISGVYDLQARDGSRVRVKPFAITDRRAQTTQAQEIRRIMQRHLEESAKQHGLSGLLSDILVGDLTQRMYKDARRIHPLRRIEIGKTEILAAPAVEVDETPVISDAPPAAESEEETAEDAAAADSEEE